MGFLNVPEVIQYLQPDVTKRASGVRSFSSSNFSARMDQPLDTSLVILGKCKL